MKPISYSMIFTSLGIIAFVAIVGREGECMKEELLMQLGQIKCCKEKKFTAWPNRC